MAGLQIDLTPEHFRKCIAEFVRQHAEGAVGLAVAITLLQRLVEAVEPVLRLGGGGGGGVTHGIQSPFWVDIDGPAGPPAAISTSSERPTVRPDQRFGEYGQTPSRRAGDLSPHRRRLIWGQPERTA